VKIKLDENLGKRSSELFRSAGHDVATVPEENLCSALDQEVIDRASSEGRCLVTLDLDFSNPLVFPPREYSGIAVLRLPSRVTDAEMFDACQTLIRQMAHEDIKGRLWIVHKGRVREYLPEDEDDEDS
jgi:predicted nuclease of predicted toxin-antitoxin system